ncbi:MAG: hypothetical protein IK990_03985 [Ruminiclostridium sp.]|nr:hypothetical protein [Ruminiclostridium sp.]
MSNKIKLNVTMKCKADSYRQANNLCIVEEVVPIPDADFLEMATYPCRDNPHITLHKDSMFADSSAMHCVLFIAAKQGDGFLVESEGYDYARYSQYISHAADIVAGQAIRLNGENKHTLETAVAARLNDIIEGMKGASDFCVSYEQFVSDSKIAECVIDCAKQLTQSRPEFAGLTIDSGNGFVEFGQAKLKTVRLISPLRVTTYDQDSGNDENLSMTHAACYRHYINSAISEYMEDEEKERGLMHWYGETDPLNNKVYSAFPSVEVIDRKLTGVTTLRVRGELTGEEQKALNEYLTGQYADGWGEGFEQQEISTGDRDCPEIYVSFWNPDDFEFTVEDEQQPEQGLSM